MRIYDKYLNMQIKEKKKLDFSFKFTSKIQVIGFSLFLLGLIFLCTGFILLLSKNVTDEVVPEDKVYKNVNIKDFNSITSSDGLVTIDSTRVIYKKNEGISELNIVITCNSQVDELPIKIIFSFGDEEVVIADYLVDLHIGEPVNLFKQNEYDLSKADSWRVEVTSKEDLETNYGFFS